MNPQATGTLFFDGACGLCTRSRDLLVRIDRTGNLQTETLQSPGAAKRLGIPPTSLLESVRWLDSSGAVYSGAEAANAAFSSGGRQPNPVGYLSDSWYRLPRGGDLPVGGRESVSVPGDHSVLRVTPERLLS